MKQAIGYIRVSTEKQANEGVSLEAQEAKIVSWCKANVVLGSPAVMRDPHPEEPRMRVIGKTGEGRYVFLVFMPRQKTHGAALRPISPVYASVRGTSHYEIKK